MGKEHFEVLPHVSSMQLAFARIKETWEEAYLTNLQTHPLETVLDRIRTAETVGLFPSDREGPAEIAHTLQARGLDYFRMYVCENLGGPDERVTLVVRPFEAVAAVQALAQSYADYYGAVADANRAQFHLYRALGQPARCVMQDDHMPSLSPPPASPATPLRTDDLAPPA